MASWMVHLRVADAFLDRFPWLAQTAFVVGNIAPDSGVPNADWSAFTPSTQISHFKVPGTQKHKEIDVQKYIFAYFNEEKRKNCGTKAYSFYLGYLIHLLTDMEWSVRIARPTLAEHPEEAERDRTGFIRKIKEDWYDLDFLYLKEHPEFRAFSVYRDAVGFENVYMDIFSSDAFDNRREYITGFYAQEKNNLDRVYPYLTKERMDAFVEDCVHAVSVWLKENIGDCHAMCARRRHTSEQPGEARLLASRSVRTGSQ